MDFTVNFQIVASHSGWPPEPTCAFLQRLVDHIRKLLIAYPRPSTLDDMINLAIEVDQQFSPLLVASKQGFLPPPTRPLTPPPPTAPSLPAASTEQTRPKPMQLGNSTLNPEERRHRQWSNLCLYCSRNGHFIYGTCLTASSSCTSMTS